ncbi:MAG: hypothetical protein IRY85_00385 [Micromonosporaceae bacterium]|nr:hypothetical protein [Micromonosporaceae bacterium]
MRWPFWLRQAGERGWTLRGLLRRLWGGRGYAVAELPLWRWLESPVDEAIAAFVRRRSRPALRDDDALHLLHFAARSALRALRERNRQYLTDAFGALSLINIDDLDHWAGDLDYRDAATVGYLAVCVAKELGLPAPERFAAVAWSTPSSPAHPSSVHHPTMPEFRRVLRSIDTARSVPISWAATSGHGARLREWRHACP